MLSRRANIQPAMSHRMSWDAKAWLNLHAHRLVVGMNNLVVLIGGGVAMAVLAATAFFTDASKEIWLLLITFSAAMVAVIYDCGRRILEAESRVRKQARADEMGTLLLMLRQRAQEIDAMDAKTYMNQLATDENKELADPRTSGVIEFVAQRVFENYGTSRAAIFAGTPKPAQPHVPDKHAWKSVEVCRLHMAAYLNTLSQTLTGIIEKTD